MELIELLKQKNIRFEKTHKSLVVYDNVYLSNSELKEFPKCSIVFLRYVDLSNTQIKEFPDYPMVFYGDVNLSHTQIKEFPKCSIVFFGRVDLGYTPIKELTDYSMVFFGDVYLNHTQIKELPDCPMTFFGNVDLGYTPLKELTDCTIKGNLYIDGTSITKIPKNLEAYRIYIPYKGKIFIYIKKDGKIGIGRDEKRIKSIEEWKKIFKEREPFDNNPDLTPEDYDVVEQDFKTAVKLLESWNS